jgi:hypothetical protein
MSNEIVRNKDDLWEEIQKRGQNEKLIHDGLTLKAISNIDREHALMAMLIVAVQELGEVKESLIEMTVNCPMPEQPCTRR